MVQTRLTLQRGPWIGERAAFFLREHVIAVGTIVDIRSVTPEGQPATMAAFIAVLGWPNMSVVPLHQYQEIRDGVWRACSHSRGFNIAGLCFDCSAFADTALTTSPTEGSAT